MLVKTNQLSKSGRAIYENALTGFRGVLRSHKFYPSQRSSNRQRSSPIEKITTNRKKTRGRKIHYQLVYKLMPVFAGFEQRRSEKTGRLLKPLRKTENKKVLIRTIKHNVSPRKK
jgi:hypothetical protein